MPMSEYELSLVNDAKKGKKKSFERLCDSFHKQLVEVVEGELYSREKAETIIKGVTNKAKNEIKNIQNPADFEGMIISLTIAECANYPRGASDGQSGAASSTSFSEEKNDRAQAQMNHSDARNASSFGAPGYHAASNAGNGDRDPGRNDWRREPAPQNAWNRQPERQEPAPQNAWNRQPERQEPAPQNTWNRQPERQESAPQNAWNRQPERQEPAPQNAWDRQPERQESAPQNAWNRQPERQEPAPQNAWNHQPERQEPAPQNAWNRQPERQEPAPQNAWNRQPERQEPAPQNAWNRQPERQDPAPRNNWNQLPTDKTAVELNTPVSDSFKPAMQNDIPVAEPIRPAMQNNRPAVEPIRPVVPNNAPGMMPNQTPAQNHHGPAPFYNANRNNAQPMQNQFAQGNNRAGADSGFPGSELPRDRFTTTPTAFRPLNMGNPTPTDQSFRQPVQNIPMQNHPQQVNQPVRMNYAQPVPNPWSAPQGQIDDDAKTELLVEEPKTELLVEEPKTELLRESPIKASDVEPQTELLPEIKLEPKPEPQPEPKPEPKPEPQPEPKLEPKPVPQPEPKPEPEPEPKPKPKPKPEPKPEPKTEAEGELLFKPDEVTQAPAKEAPKPPVAVNTAPKVGLLVCTKGENAGENFSLIAGRNRVGVSENCDVRIKDASLTDDYNFEIVYDERRENFTLVPGKLSSRLFINNDYVDTAIFMQPHDTLRTGNSEFLLVSFK